MKLNISPSFAQVTFSFLLNQGTGDITGAWILGAGTFKAVDFDNFDEFFG